MLRNRSVCLDIKNADKNTELSAAIKVAAEEIALRERKTKHQVNTWEGLVNWKVKQLRGIGQISSTEKIVLQSSQSKAHRPF